MGIAITPTGDEIVNAIAARLALLLVFHRPARALRRTGTTPLLVCVADGDEVAPAGPTIRAASDLPNVELRRFDTGHFEIYGEIRAEVVAAQIAFLRRELGLARTGDAPAALAT